MFSKINIKILSLKERALLKEVSNEDLGKVRTLVLEEDININIRDTLQRSPLMRAAFIEDKAAREGVTSLLIENGAEVNMADRHGKTALMTACGEEGREDMVKLLMECTRTDPNLQDEDGNTALIQAVEVENVPAVRMLLTGNYSHRVDVNVENFESKTALVVATKLRNKEICVLLASTGNVDLSKVPKHLLKQMPDEAKREARNSKSRLSKQMTQTSKDAPFSFANQISPSTVSKTFTIPPPIPDSEEQEDGETSSKSNDSKSERSRKETPAETEIQEQKSPEQTTTESPENISRKSSESPIQRQSTISPETQDAGADEPTIDKQGSSPLQEIEKSPEMSSPNSVRALKEESTHDKSPTRRKEVRSKSPSQEKADKPPSPKSEQKVEKENHPKAEVNKSLSDNPDGVQGTPVRRSQTRQENRQLSSRMSTASFVSEPPRLMNTTRPRGWTTGPVLPAVTKWKKRTRDRSRNRPLRGRDQQPYVTKSGRVIHPNSVHDKKYEDIQETRALSRISRMDMASQRLLREDDERSVHSEPPTKNSGGRSSRQSKITIA